jgi:hypothetical protein
VVCLQTPDSLFQISPSSCRNRFSARSL